MPEQRRRSEPLWSTVSDVLIELDARRFRAVMLILSIALATGTLVAALGISHVAAKQVDADLAATTLNSITVSLAQGVQNEDQVFPSDTLERIHSQELVEIAGLFNLVSGSVKTYVSRPPFPADGDGGVQVAGATSGFVTSLGGSFSNTSSWLLDSTERVAFIGESALERLSIPKTSDYSGIAISINGTLYSVVGSFNTPNDEHNLRVLIPYDNSVQATGTDRGAYLNVLTKPGAGAVVAQSVRQIVRPEAPEILNASQVYSFETLRKGVSSQLGKFAAFIGVFLLVLTILLISNVMSTSVNSRVGEIGVRRALGASRVRVASLFLAEGGMVGLVGGITGSAIGALAVLLVSVLNNWSAQLSPVLIVLGPVVGLLTGVLSSVQPALRASKIEPALAVRSD